MLPVAAGVVPPFLAEVVFLIVAAAAVAYVCQRVGLVPIVGFLLAGVAIGPNALGLVRDPEVIEGAAELGVLLLLFTIGIEFSLDTLARIRRLILVGGALQVALATAAVAALVVAFGGSWAEGVFSGFLVALSSTAIVTKILGDRGETSTEAGQAAVGLLVFQDVAVIAMVLVVPALGGGAGGGALGVALALGKAALLVGVGLVVARRLLPPLLEHVARTCSPELFLLTVVAICLGTAALVGLAGVSLALGAFLAGLVVSQSRFSAHALSEILPLQILFSATFFVSVGLLLDVGYMLTNLPLVLAVVAVVLVVKGATTAVAVRAAGQAAPVAAAAGLLLAQVGEFSFVLEQSGRAVGLSPMGLGEAGSQTFIAATVVLMALTPVLAPFAGRLAARVQRKMDAHHTGAAALVTEADVVDGHAAATGHDALAAPSSAGFADLDGHVVVAGYGALARPLVRALDAAGLAVAVATLSPDGATEAEGEGRRVLRGDYARQPILDGVGLGRASVLVVPDDTPEMAARVVAVARALNPAVHIVAAAPTAAAAAGLRAAGADTVVAAETETAAGLVSEVLRHAGHDADGYLAALRTAALAGASPSPPPVPPAVPAQTAPWLDLTTPVTLAVGPACSHGDHVHAVRPGTAGCAECLATGSRWVHLRVCMECGHVGCCDSSPNKHATAHFHRIGHPVMRSVEPGETWGWCYVDEVDL
jgi:CPA2 family monovalent cation:H+ antiporter-2